MEVVERLNPVGTSLSVSGLILLIYALTSGNEAGWSNGAVIGTLVAAIVLLVSFIFFETKMSRFPFVPRHMRKSSELLTGCVSAAMTYAVWQGANYFLTLQLQGKLQALHMLVLYLLDVDIGPRSRIQCTRDIRSVPASRSYGIPSEYGDPAPIGPDWTKGSYAYQLVICHRWCDIVLVDKLSD